MRHVDPHVIVIGGSSGYYDQGSCICQSPTASAPGVKQMRPSGRTSFRNSAPTTITTTTTISITAACTTLRPHSLCIP
ncbi:uncharacterized protein CTRU02_205747 [Colletotrichum truncatum]|uniref:Uncharacterized protein n=1 Tax=Colletotrichum truncatum TaxID=5467 RepID=A0ACC3Z4W5_COLTU